MTHFGSNKLVRIWVLRTVLVEIRALAKGFLRFSRMRPTKSRTAPRPRRRRALRRDAVREGLPPLQVEAGESADGTAGRQTSVRRSQTWSPQREGTCLQADETKHAEIRADEL
uniref:Uncharacterized protein n=1 Tax=Arundo donax TaxID=35708 RepID=A0A0A9A0R8_ARUDO